MPRFLCVGLLLINTTLASAELVNFEWADVGNAGNAIGRDLFDPAVGAVEYSFAISKTEVTNSQYVAFLNEVDPTGANALSLYNASMAGNFGGIENTGMLDGSRYIAQPDREQNPVTYVSFFDAMRFVNWLHNGQGSGDTESGAYTIEGSSFESRSEDAQFWVPSEDEWVKAAHHDASAGTAADYFLYATGSDSVPISDKPGDDPSAANYYNQDNVQNGFNEGFAANEWWDYPYEMNPFTDVGAYKAAASPYGTYDQNGNVTEWTDTGFGGKIRTRGGSWVHGSDFLRSITHESYFPLRENDYTGFRVATVPEPSTLVGALLIVALLPRLQRA